MRTLFLNPNSSDAITATLRRQISAQGLPPETYEVRQLDGAPRIIGSTQDNASAQALLEARFKELTEGFARLVMMSSLDTGYETACRLGGIEVLGFTRSVLARHRGLGQRLQAITFDASMTSLYRALFEAPEQAGVMQSIAVLPRAPGEVAGDRGVVLETLRTMCEELAAASNAPIFIVGAVGLELGETLREQGFAQVIDPVADLIAHLRSSEPAGVSANRLDPG